MTTWHPSILGARQRRALSQLAPLCKRHDLYLAGGTALALELGHRKSVDLDWFTSSKKLDPVSVAHEWRDSGVPLEITSTAPGTLHARLAGVRVTVLRYRYPLLRRLWMCRPLNCSLAAPNDIAAMKLSAIVQRGARRDFVDLWALLESGFSLRHMLREYQRKFGINDVANVLYAVTYFDDADAEPMPRLIWKTSWKEIKASIVAAVSSL